MQVCTGPGALGSVGNWAALLGKSALVIVASRDRERLGGLIAESLARSGVNSDIRTFDGDSTMHDIVRLAGLASACDMVIGVGSGRIMDASRRWRTSRRCPLSYARRWRPRTRPARG